MIRMRRWPRVLISAATSAVLATAVSVPAWAAGRTIHYTPCPFGKCVSMGNQPANPSAGLPPMWAWVWFSNAGGLTIAYGIDQVAFPFPKVPAKLANAWQKHPIDNPAPLLWYYHHVSKTELGTTVFGPGVRYSTSLIQKMKAEHFSPAMIGGPLPPNWNAVPTKRATPPPPKAKQPKTSKPKPKAMPKGSKAPRARTPRGKAPKAHAKAPDAADGAEHPAGTRHQHTTVAPSGLPPSFPLPPGFFQETPPSVAQHIFRHDQAVLQAARHAHQASRHSASRFVIGGSIALLIIAAAGVASWRRRSS